MTGINASFAAKATGAALVFGGITTAALRSAPNADGSPVKGGPVAGSDWSNIFLGAGIGALGGVFIPTALAATANSATLPSARVLVAGALIGTSLIGGITLGNALRE